MSRRAAAWAAAQRPRIASRARALRVLGALAGDDGEIEQLGIASLASLASTSARTAQRSIRQFEAAGLLSRAVRYAANGGKITSLTLDFGKTLPAAEQSATWRLAALVARLLAGCASADGDIAHAPVDGLARQAGLSRHALLRQIRALEGAGVFSHAPRYSLDGRFIARARLNPARAAAAMAP